MRSKIAERILDNTPLETIIRVRKKYKEYTDCILLKVYKDLPEFLKPIKMKILQNELSFPGGANKHLMHPWENRDLTFYDLKEIINRALSGTLDKERYVSEKPDGQNLKITYKDGEIKAARNKAELENPLNINEISKKFEGRKEIHDAFYFALKDLNTAFKTLDKETLDEIFEKGFNYLNLEIVYPPSANVIYYYRPAFIQFHGIFEYDCRWNVSRTYPAAGKLIHKLLEDKNATKQETFDIIPHNEIILEEQENIIDKLDHFILSLKENMHAPGSLVGYGNTISDYFYFKWQKEINKEYPGLRSEQTEILINRWSNNIKEVRISEKNFKNYSYSIKNYEATKVEKLNKQFTQPLEIIFLQLGVFILKPIKNVLSAKPEKTKDCILSDISYMINIPMKERGDLNNEKICYELNRFSSLGSYNSVVPMEGIVFIYKGNEYKLTGIFAPINQILGYYKYKR